jgi:hypothetical protein
MFKAVDLWFPGYIRSLLSRLGPVTGTRHLIVCVCDHYEPFRDGVDVVAAHQTVHDWLSAYPGSVDSFRDADGMPPRHTFFYPQEEYDAAILDSLAAFCRRGFGEVEIHLHHRHDTAEGFREKLVAFRDLLHQCHGFLGEEKNIEQKSRSPQRYSSSSLRYAFIHGNWSLCNSRPDGDWCGVNEELGILSETGCYADFTFPSAPSPTQPKMVNALYYATDTPGRPRGADRGERVGFRVQAGQEAEIRDPVSGGILNPEPCIPSKHPLLLITGPLALNWCRRKWGVLPRLENADISATNPPTADRVRLWARQQIGVIGRPDWVFVKLHTHGCVPGNARVLLGSQMRVMHEALQREFNDGQHWQLHYVTAREMHNLVKAAEANLPGSPGQYRDTPISPPPLIP